MTSPINFGGGVGTQPVIQNPSIGEQLGPLLEQLQFAQQQRLQQQQLAAAQANAERDDQLRALNQLTSIANDPVALRSEVGGQLADIAQVPEKDLEDMAKFSDKDIQTVLKNVETSQWAMALKGASEELKQKILGNMSKRGGDLLAEEMDFLGSVRLSNVEQTQQQIVDIVRRLEDSEEITLGAEENEESFVS